MLPECSVLLTSLTAVANATVITGCLLLRESYIVLLLIRHSVRQEPCGKDGTHTLLPLLVSCTLLWQGSCTLPLREPFLSSPFLVVGRAAW